MIPVPSGVRVWLAVGHTDMRRGMNSLAVQIQEGSGRDPHAGDLCVFRGTRSPDQDSLARRHRHVAVRETAGARPLHLAIAGQACPGEGRGAVAITAAQLAYMLDGIDWRNPVRTWRPEAAG
jgi:transposase